MTVRHEPLFRGGLIALASATMFGLTTPVIARYSQGAGAFTTAALLYGGAAAAAVLLRLVSRRSGRALSVSALPRLLGVALFGAALAPSLLAWGIGKAGPTVSSLVLNLEAAATIGLASLVYAEPIGRRVTAAMVFMFVGGALVALDVATKPVFELAGVLAVAGAAVAWAVDSTLIRTYLPSKGSTRIFIDTTEHDHPHAPDIHHVHTH